jgi:ferredoxin
MKVTIEDGCIACGLCTDACPTVFKMGDEVAEVIAAEVPVDCKDKVKEVAEDCPVEVIIVT